MTIMFIIMIDTDDTISAVAALTITFLNVARVSVKQKASLRNVILQTLFYSSIDHLVAVHFCEKREI